MNVTLIHFTGKGSPDERWAAANLLLFTKRTRLELSPAAMAEIEAWSPERKLEELRYVADTIPSSWEFVDYVFLITDVSRAYTHQQVRTRSGSYAQQAQRVVNMGSFDYVYTERNLRDPTAKRLLDDCLANIRTTYAALLAAGQPVEDARGILPTNITTNILAKFNMRAFVELVRARGGGRTQAEYRAVVAQMVDAVLTVHPWMECFLHGDRDRDYYRELEKFAERELGANFAAKNSMLKIVDRMRRKESKK